MKTSQTYDRPVRSKWIFKFFTVFFYYLRRTSPQNNVVDKTQKIAYIYIIYRYMQHAVEIVMLMHRHCGNPQTATVAPI